MTRKSQTALPSLTKLAGIALAAAAFAAPAQAAQIGFETGYSYPTGSGDTYVESGFQMRFEAYDVSDVGAAVGNFIDGSDPYPCVEMACPTNNSSMYYGAINDSIVWIESATAGGLFNFNSLDASFIGADANLASYPVYPGFLRVQGFLADGSSTYEDILFGRPGAGGFRFGTYDFSEVFSQTEFVAAALFAFACDAALDCQAFETNQGQFAIDNLDLNSLVEVPEPASAAIFGLGLMGLITGARRRKA